MARVVVSIRPSSTTGKSGLTRYIAESKRNPEKEGLGPDEPRPLFSATHDNLTYIEANQFLQLATDTELQTDDLIHMFISPERGVYEELGENREEKYAAFREIIRETCKVIEKKLDVVELYWIAGIHLNTDVPHVHIAICRHGCDRISERHKYIKHFPRTLLSHNIPDDHEEKQFVPGMIAETVSDGIKRRRDLVRQRSGDTARSQFVVESQGRDHSDNTTRINIEVRHEPKISEVKTEPHDRKRFQENDRERGHATTSTLSKEPALTQPKSQPSSDPQKSTTLWRDRYILGRSMVARAEVDRLQKELQSLQAHGDKRRFRVYDASRGRTRRISEFDIRRRADASAAAALRQSPIADRDHRHERRQAHYTTEIERHEKGIHDHRIVVSKTIDKLEADLTAAQEQHAKLIPHVNRIREDCQASLPVPLLTPPELDKLQEQAIASRNPQRVNTLETIREALANERGEPSRSDREIARLDGQLLVARSAQAASQERVSQFERAHHQTRFEIDGEKYSLADLDRRISEQDNRARFFGSPLKITNVHLIPSSRRDAAAQAEGLRQIRALVVETIEVRRQELCSSAKEAQLLTATLSDIHHKEHARLIERHGERQEKILTRKEINQLLDHATLTLDPAMLQHALILETRFEERQPDHTKPPLSDQAARAIGREILTDIALKQATASLQSFDDNKIFTPVSVKDSNGNEHTTRLFDFRHSRHPVIWLVQRIVESKERRHLRHETINAVNREHNQLKEEVTSATKCKEIANNLGDFYRERMRGLEQPIPDPAFTPKQIIQLEIYALRQTELAERTRVDSLIQRSEIASLKQTQQTQKTHEPQLFPTTDPPTIDPQHVRKHQQQTREQTLHPAAPSIQPGLTDHASHASPEQAHLVTNQQPDHQMTSTQPIQPDPDLDLIR